MSEEMLKEQAVERADAVLDAAGITPNLPIDRRIKELVRQRDAANTQAASRERIFDTLRSERDLARSQFNEADAALDTAGIVADLVLVNRVRELVCERDAAVEQWKERGAQRNACDELRQIKLDLLAMGRLEKLACALVMGDASPNDVGEDGD